MHEQRPIEISQESIACQPNFAVVQEHADWIIVDKAAPLIVHPSNGKVEPNLLEGVAELLVYECMAENANLSLINRLDRETSGLCLIGKNSTATRTLGRAMERREIAKSYTALVYGHPEWESHTENAPILRQGEVMPSEIYVRQCTHSSGKPCSTEFHVLQRGYTSAIAPHPHQPVSLIHCIPHTGRTHQIRVHLAHVGYPIVGDKIYGPSQDLYLQFLQYGWSDEMQKKLWLPRHALHAGTLAFSYAGIPYHATASLPADIAELYAC